MYLAQQWHKVVPSKYLVNEWMNKWAKKLRQKEIGKAPEIQIFFLKSQVEEVRLRKDREGTEREESS